MDIDGSGSASGSALVVIESPFAGDLQTNLHYADCLMYDALERGEAPFLGHLLYPRVLDDDVSHHRELGIRSHIAVLQRADIVVIGLDLGAPTRGMRMAIAVAVGLKKPIVERYLGANWKTKYRLRPTLGYCVHPYQVVAHVEKQW